MDYMKFTQKYWDQNAKLRRGYSQRCTEEDLEKARRGHPQLYVLCEKPLESDWFSQDWRGLKVFAPGLAGGTHVPLMAAAGAEVTSFDISEKQLMLDQEVCSEEGLEIHTIQGDVQDMKQFNSNSFDLVITATVSIYIKNVTQFWREIYRLLRPGGEFITGAVNPVFYALDEKKYDEGLLSLDNKIPYDSTANLTPEDIARKKSLVEPFQFGHSLQDILGGITEAGFSISRFEEGPWTHQYLQKINEILPTLMAIKAQKSAT